MMIRLRFSYYRKVRNAVIGLYAAYRRELLRETARREARQDNEPVRRYKRRSF